MLTNLLLHCYYLLCRQLASDSEWAKMYGIRKQQQQQEQEQQSFIGCEDEQQEHNYYKQLCNDVEQSIEVLYYSVFHFITPRQLMMNVHS